MQQYISKLLVILYSQPLKQQLTFSSSSSELELAELCLGEVVPVLQLSTISLEEVKDFETLGEVGVLLCPVVGLKTAISLDTMTILAAHAWLFFLLTLDLQGSS